MPEDQIQEGHEGYFRVTAPGYRADFRLAPLWNWLMEVGALGALAVSNRVLAEAVT